MIEHAALPFWMILAMASLAVSLAGVWRARRQGRKGTVDLAVTVTGFSEIIFQVIVILTFQSLYGTAYEFIALMMAVFMIGLVLGAYWAGQMCRRYSREKNFQIFTRVQFGVAGYPLLLPVLFVIFRDTGITQQAPGLFMPVFACLPLVAGFLGGMQYPLGAAIRSEEPETISGSPGLLYALDALGASAGALLTGLLLIPLYGITAVCILSAVMNGIVYAVCLWDAAGQPARSSV